MVNATLSGTQIQSNKVNIRKRVILGPWNIALAQDSKVLHFTYKGIKQFQIARDNTIISSEPYIPNNDSMTFSTISGGQQQQQQQQQPATIYGCTNNMAMNYLPTATAESGNGTTCIFSGSVGGTVLWNLMLVAANFGSGNAFPNNSITDTITVKAALEIGIQSNITCLTTSSQVNVLNAGGNKYVFNGENSYDSSKKYGLYSTTYTFTNIPSGHPIAILNNGNSNITYTGDASKKLSKTVSGTTNDGTYDFYHGDVSVNVTGDFGTVSVYCYYHGYMGGQNLLTYTSVCQNSGGELGNSLLSASPVTGNGYVNLNLIDNPTYKLIITNATTKNTYIYNFNKPTGITTGQTLTVTDLTITEDNASPIDGTPSS